MVLIIYTNPANNNMNKSLTNFFNNGDNKGDVTIVCNDGTKITCHSFVLDTQTEFGITKLRFNEHQQKSGTYNELNFDYSKKIIILGLNKLYSSEYILVDLDCDEIIELITFFDELQVCDLSLIKKELVDLFKPKITEGNWINLLEIVYTNIIFKELSDVLLKFYIDNMSEPSTLPIKEKSVSDKLTEIYTEYKQRKFFKFDYLTEHPEFIKANNFNDVDFAHFGLDYLAHIRDFEPQSALNECLKLKKIIGFGNNILCQYFKHIEKYMTQLNKEIKLAKKAEKQTGPKNKDDDAEDSDDDTPKKSRSPYQIFIAQELKRQREQKPGLKNNEYMKLAATEWQKYKDINGINLAISPISNHRINSKGKTSSEEESEDESD